MESLPAGTITSDYNERTTADDAPEVKPEVGGPQIPEGMSVARVGLDAQFLVDRTNREH
jgi:hypothetical protein